MITKYRTFRSSIKIEEIDSRAKIDKIVTYEKDGKEGSGKVDKAKAGPLLVEGRVAFMQGANPCPCFEYLVEGRSISGCDCFGSTVLSPVSLYACVRNQAAQPDFYSCNHLFLILKN